MPQPDHALSESLVTEKLTTFLQQRGMADRALPLTSDTRLFSSGLLDSLGFMELILFLETEFTVRLQATVGIDWDKLDSTAAVLSSLRSARGDG